MRIIFYCFFLALLSSTSTSFAQIVVVNAEPATATLAVDCKTFSSPVKIKGNQIETGVLAFAPGYATQGITATELGNIGKSDYTIKLNKIKKIDTSFTSRKIEFSRMTDRTGQIERGTLTGGLFYANHFPATNLNETKYLNAIKTSIGNAGYNIVGTNNIFSSKSDMPEMALAGEVTWCTKDTKGKGFQVSILIHWSLYSVSKEKVIFETTTGGYSDSDKKGTFQDELLLAIKDALAGVLNDNKFQDWVSKKVSTPTKLEPIILAKPNFKQLTSYSAVVKESIKSTVTIKTDFGIGSGFIISNDGYILTNNHVINSAEKIEIVFDNGFSFEAKLIRADEDKDVALLKMSGSGIKPLTLSEVDELASSGTEVIAIGTPEDIKLGQSVTKGIISGKRKLDERVFLQTDVAINSGNSGGPLINIETGGVIGIVAAKIKAKGVEGLGFAIPIGEAIKALGLRFE